MKYLKAFWKTFEKGIKNTSIIISIMVFGLGLIYYASVSSYDFTFLNKIFGIMGLGIFGVFSLLALLIVTMNIIDWFESKIYDFKQNLKDEV